ncbi:MAG: hypothetical protein GTO30_18640 [Acidobacteria bacterium]|nr:hypothetical protein [Acidobacteriota bacterium]NIO58444.1 hypothetical protein [Acidobacteriota bacterium]NIQ84176.1 hypothetical protein [Acidobacteriota bacterium]
MTPGTHEITALLEFDEDGSKHEKRVVVDVGRGEQQRVVLSAGSGYGAPLSLKVD